MSDVSSLRAASGIWAPFAPGPGRPWTPRLAAHLLRRAGFGPTEAGWRAARRDGPAAAVERLLTPDERARAFDAGFDALEPARPGSAAEFTAWWLRRMLETPCPFTEWLTLFWHGGLAIRMDQLPEGGLLAARIRRLRRLVHGSLADLLAAPLADPAVLLACGGGANRKARPNRILARAYLEFALGPDAVRERDVTEAARALTGWFVRRGRVRFVEREFDPGEKTLFGRRGPWGRDDLARLTLEQPATWRWLARRLYRALVSEEGAPDARRIEPLAAQLAATRDLRAAVKTILCSRHFYSPAALGRRVKSPVELAVGLARAAGVILPTTPLAHDLARLGQDLARPPTRRGWAGGAAWLTDRLFVRRENLLTELLAPGGRYGGRLRAAVSASLIERLWPGGLPLPAPSGASPGRRRQSLREPEFQLT